MNAEEILRRYSLGERNFSSDDYISISGANLQGANLSQADLSCIEMSEINLSQANLSQCDLSSSGFAGANLSQANLRGANLEWAELNGADLSAANLFRANLKSSQLNNANLRGANLCKANLENAEIKGADLSDADLRGVNLEYVECDEYTKFPQGFNNPCLKGLWINSNTFINYDQITTVEIAKSWDSFSDALRSMGHEDEEINEIVENSFSDRYSRYDLPLEFSDLIGLNWDNIKVVGRGIYEKLDFSRDILDLLVNATYDYKIELDIWLYT